MNLPYPTDPSLPANPAPVFSDTTAARGDHLRANNAEIWANLLALANAQLLPNISLDTDATMAADSDTRVPSQKASLALIKNTMLWGGMVGGLRFNSTSVPPYVRAGAYETNNGKTVNLAADAAMATTDMIGDKAIRANLWYYVMMNAAGVKKIQIACGGTAVKTYNITSISGGNTINFSGSAGGVQPVAGMIAVIEGITASGEVGYYNIASVHGATVDYIVLDGTVTNQAGAGGTVKIYYRMDTYHGAGTLTGITTAANALFYTPSPADAELLQTANDHAWFDPARNGYYSKFTGHTEYRIIGVFNTNNSNAITDVISYRPGHNKNDNQFNLSGWAAQVTNTQRPKTILKIWGNDYCYTDSSGTPGTKFTFKRGGKVSMMATGSYATTGQVAIELNGTDTFGSGVKLAEVYIAANGSHMTLCSVPYLVNQADYTKIMSDVQLADAAAFVTNGAFEIN
jgi:hypothetical protein